MSTVDKGNLHRIFDDEKWWIADYTNEDCFDTAEDYQFIRFFLRRLEHVNWMSASQLKERLEIVRKRYQQRQKEIARFLNGLDEAEAFLDEELKHESDQAASQPAP